MPTFETPDPVALRISIGAGEDNISAIYVRVVSAKRSQE